MAEKIRYPQIPSTVWWGVRAILNKTPSVTVDERLLGIQLNVQEAAARQYISELKAVGILNDEGKATPLALKWRLDESYSEAVTQLVEGIYPEGLRHLAPPGEADRQKAVRWFQQEGLGQGAAGNKAATYLMVSSAQPNEAPGRANGGKASREEGGSRATQPAERRSERSSPNNPAKRAGPSASGSKTRKVPSAYEALPLNVNVQIHISSDAGSEQIESIFAAMRRYLYDDPSH